MNRLMPLSPVRAETRKKSDTAASLMKCLLPLSSQPLGVRTARVVMPCASDPAPASVMAIEHTRSPRTQGASQRATCAPWHASSAS